MKKILLLLIIVIIVFALGFLIFTWQSRKSSYTEKKEPAYKTQQNSEGEVTVEITPLNLSSGENVKFSVLLDTHSVELDKDLKKVAILTDDKGNDYKPISWSGGKGGHHLEGELVFPPFSEKSKSLKLTIRDIAGIDKVFSWDLN